MTGSSGAGSSGSGGYNAKAPQKGGAKKSRTMMSREW